MSATACTKREMSVVQDVAFSRVVSACLKWQGLHQEKNLQPDKHRKNQHQTLELNTREV